MTNNHNHDTVLPYHQLRSDSFDGLAKTLTWLFINGSHKVHPLHWQGVDVSKRPEMASFELMNVNMTVPLRGIELLDHWRQDVAPNLPWADNHFEERVCGYPINPGIEWAHWPWGDNASKFLDDRGMFNHNYMERYWPKKAGLVPEATKTVEDHQQYEFTRDNNLKGIRGPYGDLDDLVDLLVKDPQTRQAWVPIFFPEDTGTANPGRKPCTLGYQFIMRNGELHVYYPLRSCDFIRHWRDDVYLTIRLLLWVLNECRKRDNAWQLIRPGSYNMQCTSLHVFANDYRLLETNHARH